MEEYDAAEKVSAAAEQELTAAVDTVLDSSKGTAGAPEPIGDVRPVSETGDDKALPTFPEKADEQEDVAAGGEPLITSTEIDAPAPAATPLPDVGLQQARPVTPALDKTADILSADEPLSAGAERQPSRATSKKEADDSSMLDSRMKLAAGIENEEMLEEVKSSPGYSKTETGKDEAAVAEPEITQTTRAADAGSEYARKVSSKQALASENLPSSIQAPLASAPATSAAAAAAPDARDVKEYLDTTVVPVLREGLRLLAKQRPADPFEFLGDFIKAHR
ncbi:hypothetical protein WJX84_005271 [Apatococcus fuscideae]|uniref:Uncharacterized protein n=1 Tax=Apatococcus fuscideae TaxID=2026836 RepID=A0AAW1T325_9CHLO